MRLIAQMWGCSEEVASVTSSGSAWAAESYHALPEVMHFLGIPHPLTKTEVEKPWSFQAVMGLLWQYLMQAGLAEALQHIHCSLASSSAQCCFLSFPFVGVNPSYIIFIYNFISALASGEHNPWYLHYISFYCKMMRLDFTFNFINLW